MALRLLVVEDHEPTLAVLRRLLTRAGHGVVTATSVASAVAAAEAGQFDGLISDLGLPDGTGLDVITKLRARQPQLRGIALSGYGMDEDVRRSLEAGFSTASGEAGRFRSASAGVAGDGRAGWVTAPKR